MLDTLDLNGNPLLNSEHMATYVRGVTNKKIIVENKCNNIKAVLEVGKLIKSLFERTLALILIMLFSPIYIIVSLIIWMKLGRPILFRQKRPGLNEEIFEMYKFRTMKNDKDENGELLPNEQRLSRVGNYIRATSLDELPQIFNVLKGNMSFIGPRPLVIEYLEFYDDDQKRRHDVKPGLTGWAQVNGRNAISWEQKFEYDVWYVDNQSFWVDIKIIFLTLMKVTKRSDISSGTEFSMKRFMGSNKK